MRSFLPISCIFFALLGCQKADRDVDSNPQNSTYISGRTFTDKKVYFKEVDGYAVFEGDIVLGTLEELSRNEIPGDKMAIGPSQNRHSALWPDAKVPYVIEEDFPNPERVENAIKHYHSRTSIRFTKRTNEESYVKFHATEKGCSSRVGRSGGEQLINLSKGCLIGQTIHEIGHALGLWHEQSREDRDKFINIVWDNIIPEEKSNFEQHITDGDDLGAYDLSSIMHYGAYAFSKNGKPTLTDKEGRTDGFGQRISLSEKDQAALEKLYP